MSAKTSYLDRPSSAPWSVWAYAPLACLLLGTIWLTYWWYQATQADPDDIKPGMEEFLNGSAGMILINFLGMILCGIGCYRRSQPEGVMTFGCAWNCIVLVLIPIATCFGFNPLWVFFPR